jgi:hypothetical protein
MNTKYYVDVNGNCLGGFCGSEPPEGAIEVPTAPIHGLDKWVNGAWVAYVPVQSKGELLASITVTTQAGNTFDGNETARGDMMAALAAGELLGETETYWKMANNDKVLVTRDELLEALSLAIKEKGRIVGAIE